jgi:hypothetical protein
MMPLKLNASTFEVRSVPALDKIKMSSSIADAAQLMKFGIKLIVQEEIEY